MKSESIVYGCIQHLPFGDPVARQASCLHNRRVLRTLPSVELNELFYRELFTAQTPLDKKSWRSQVIHFGASYESVEYEWGHWIRQFEELLKDMYWVSAVVHLETELYGTHSFNWQAAEAYHAPGEAPLQVRCEWAREGLV